MWEFAGFDFWNMYFGGIIATTIMMLGYSAFNPTKKTNMIDAVLSFVIVLLWIIALPIGIAGFWWSMKDGK